LAVPESGDAEACPEIAAGDEEGPADGDCGSRQRAGINEQPPGSDEAPRVRYVLLPVFEALTGYTRKAIRRKVDGVEGKDFRRAPDGRVLVDLDGYERWVEGRREWTGS
jgi:hypothetical protein